MNVTTTRAKIYYLPAAEPATTPPAPSPWTRLRRRMVRSWWQARLAIATMRFGRARRARRLRDDDSMPLFRAGGDDYAALLRNVIAEGPAELIERPRRSPVSPARILDFEAARLRLRPATD
jgi:hypothetical protein